MAQKTLKCNQCDRTFKMPAHLARHMAVHNRGKRKKRTGASKSIRIGRGPVGRPRGIVGRLGLNSLSLDDLYEVIVAARELAKRRLDDIKQVIG